MYTAETFQSISSDLKIAKAAVDKDVHALMMTEPASEALAVWILAYRYAYQRLSAEMRKKYPEVLREFPRFLD